MEFVFLLSSVFSIYQMKRIHFVLDFNNIYFYDNNVFQVILSCGKVMNISITPNDVTHTRPFSNFIFIYIVTVAYGVFRRNMCVSFTMKV